MVNVLAIALLWGGLADAPLSKDDFVVVGTPTIPKIESKVVHEPRVLTTRAMDQTPPVITAPLPPVAPLLTSAEPSTTYRVVRRYYVNQPVTQNQQVVQEYNPPIYQFWGSSTISSCSNGNCGD